MSKHFKKSLLLIGVMSLTSLTQQAVAMKEDDTDSKSRITIQHVPTGSIIQFAGSTEPEGWLICDGRTISRSKYQKLFNVIGKTYTYKIIISPKKESEQILSEDTFCIPDMRGRVPVGVDSDSRPNFVTSNRVTSNNKLGESGGEQRHKLTIDEMPRHNHDIPGGYIITTGSSKYSQSTSHYGTGDTEYKGNDVPHNNMQPYLILNYIIKH